jgi:hypothetical protein
MHQAAALVVLAVLVVDQHITFQLLQIKQAEAEHQDKAIKAEMVAMPVVELAAAVLVLLELILTVMLLQQIMVVKPVVMERHHQSADHL